MRRRVSITMCAATLAVIAACGTQDLTGTPLAADEPDAAVTVTQPTSLPPGACEGPRRLEKMDPATLPSCCDGARCVPRDKVPGIVRRALAECAGGYCVPDAFLRSGGAPPPSCTAFNGAEGACISTCVPEVGANKDLLEQGTCADGERCAPCVHPIKQERTGVCDFDKQDQIAAQCADGGAPGGTGGGAGEPRCPHEGPPVVDPATLPVCGGGGAHCLDEKLVPPALAPKLARCDATSLCVPDPFLRSGGRFIPPTCTSLGGFEGRCLHAALPDVASQKDLLPQSTCAPEERCAPCFDPRDAKDTGACKQSCDPGPKQGPPACPHAGPPVFDPARFPSCYAGGGAHCLPQNMVTPQLASQLAPCSGGYCVPDAFIRTAGRYVPPTCNGIGGGEGRCLHRAIPKVASQSDLLQSTCATFERCVPCTNPIDGTDTGACRQSCDPGPARPPYVFGRCCTLYGATRGRCVPASMVPDEQETNLSTDACTRAGDLCVPNEMLTKPFTPPACSAFSIAYFGSYQGVCLSNCLQFAGLESLVIKQGTCDALHQCVPCYKPLGQPTGAPGCN